MQQPSQGVSLTRPIFAQRKLPSAVSCFRQRRGVSTRACALAQHDRRNNLFSEEVLRSAQDFGSVLPLRSRPLNASISTRACALAQHDRWKVSGTAILYFSRAPTALTKSASRP